MREGDRCRGAFSGRLRLDAYNNPVGLGERGNSENSDKISDTSENFSASLEPRMARVKRRNDHGLGAARPPRGPSAQRDADRREAANLIRLVAEPRSPDEDIQQWIRRAATKLSWSLSRTEDIWRQEARRIEAWELDTLRDNIRETFRTRGPRR